MSAIQEILITNANVRTVDSKDSVASAVLIRGGRFAAVGQEAEVRAASTADAQVMDLGGRTVVPGFIDPHNHLSLAAFAPVTVDCTTPPLESLEEVLQAIADHCRSLPEGQWVMGVGFHASQVRQLRNPTRGELDEASPKNPFFLVDASCHAGYANSLALRTAGISAHSPQPWGGEFEKDADGEPTGTLLEAAINVVHSAAWSGYAENDWDRAVGLLNAKMRDYLAVGLTGVGDALVTTKAAELYRRASAQGMMPLTVQQLHGGDHFFSMQDLGRTDVIDRIKQPGDAMLRGGAMKIFVDRFYPDGPAIDELHDGCTRHIGTPFYSKDEVHQLALGASRLGIATAIHAMGNCAVDFVLDAYEDVRRQSKTDSVLRMEHAFIAEARQGTRMAELGVDLVVNPGLGYNWGEVFDSCRHEGQDHLRVLPVRSMIDAGVRVSLGSDHPCGVFAPMQIISTAVTRKTGRGTLIDYEEAITAAEALRLATINAAHASDRAAEEGSIEVGKRANLVVLDRDIVTCPAEELWGTEIDMTYVDGALAHSREL